MNKLASILKKRNSNNLRILIDSLSSETNLHYYHLLKIAEKYKEELLNPKQIESEEDFNKIKNIATLLSPLSSNKIVRVVLNTEISQMLDSNVSEMTNSEFKMYSKRVVKQSRKNKIVKLDDLLCCSSILYDYSFMKDEYDFLMKNNVIGNGLELHLPVESLEFRLMSNYLNTCIWTFAYKHLKTTFKMIVKKDGEYFSSAEYCSGKMEYYSFSNTMPSENDLIALELYFERKYDLIEKIYDKMLELHES